MTVSPGRVYARLACLLFALAMPMFSSGCSTVLLLGYLIGGPPTVEPDFQTQTGKALVKSKKTVAVICFAPKELKWDNDAVDYELAKYLAYQLKLKEVTVVDPDRVNRWIDENPNYSMQGEVGDFFEADYVIHLDMRKYSLFEENSHDLYRGRADVIVTVFEKQKGTWSQIYNKSKISQFPTGGPISLDKYPYDKFKKLYLSTLSGEIGKLFYPYSNGDDIPNRMVL